VTLLLIDGDTVKGAFLDLQPELWSEDRTVLTLWLDPGRIKRDLIPNRTLGTPLKKGNQYTLVISDTWRDHDGLPLHQSVSKIFNVGPSDSISPSPHQWNLLLPLAGSDDALSIRFGAPLDYSLIMSALHIKRDNGSHVTGKWESDFEERGVTFIPEKTWEPGKYALIVDTRLEDLAGNNINRLFDRDVTQTKKESTGDTVTIKFELK
jgi:hypothetical protein